VAISGRAEDDREVAARTRAGGGGIVAERLKEEDEGRGARTSRRERKGGGVGSASHRLRHRQRGRWPARPVGGRRPKREERRSGLGRGGEAGPRLGQKVSRAEF
jgi:hypothetical protein